MAQEGLHRLAQRGRALVARLGLLRRGPVTDLGELDRDPGRVLDRRRPERRGELLQDAIARVPLRPGDDLVQQRPEQIHVGGGTDLLDARRGHLRRHVARRARDAGDPLCLLVEAHREAPVDDVDLLERADHHVLRLEIPVHDAATVGEVDRVADLHERPQLAVHILGRGRIVGGVQRGQAVPPRRALDELHDEDRLVVVGQAEGVDGDDVGMLEPAGDPGLPQQLGSRRLPPAVAPQLLDCDPALQRRLRGRPNRGRAADADRLLQAQVRRPVRRLRLAQHDHLRQVDHSLGRFGGGGRDGAVLVDDERAGIDAHRLQLALVRLRPHPLTNLTMARRREPTAKLG